MLRNLDPPIVSLAVNVYVRRTEHSLILKSLETNLDAAYVPCDSSENKEKYMSFKWFLRDRDG